VPVDYDRKFSDKLQIGILEAQLQLSICFGERNSALDISG
jgi:hypothetical protein